MLITTYNRVNTNFKKIISKHLPYLGSSSATRIWKENFMISYRKPPSLRDMFLRGKIPQPTHPQSRVIAGYTFANLAVKILNRGPLRIE